MAKVELAGTTVKNASLSNIDEITRMRLDVGDMVVIQKSGEIIPGITGVVVGPAIFVEGQLDTSMTPRDLPERDYQADFEAKSVWSMPATCPECNTPLVRQGVHYFCQNTQCPARLTESLAYVVSKGCLDFRGIGDAQCKSLVKAGRTTLLDLLVMPEEEVNELFKPAMAKRFLSERERVKTAPLWRKLKALGINDVS